MKNIILVLTIVFISFGLFGCQQVGKKQELEAFYKDEKIVNVDKILIQDGSTGYSKTITEQKQINEFLSLIKDTVFTPQDNQEKRDGWRYGITLFDGERMFKFTLSQIGNTYYDSNPDIHPIVESYYRQLEVFTYLFKINPGD